MVNPFSYLYLSPAFQCYLSKHAPWQSFRRRTTLVLVLFNRCGFISPVFLVMFPSSGPSRCCSLSYPFPHCQRHNRWCRWISQHCIFFSLCSFSQKVRTKSDSSRCHSLSISVKRLSCTTFAPYKSLFGLGFSSLLIFSIENTAYSFTRAEICKELALIIPQMQITWITIHWR